MRADGAALIIDYGHAESADRRHAAGGRRARLRRSADGAGPGRSHRPCRLSGAGARGRRHGRARARPDRRRASSCAGSASSSAPRRSRRRRRPSKAADDRRRRSTRLTSAERTGMGKLFKAIGLRRPEARRAAGLRDREPRVSRRMLPSRLARPRCPASATPSSRARAACRTASMRASTAASARDDAPAKVAENRARMAAALGVRAGPFRHRLPDPFARRGDGRAAVAPSERPRADAIVTRAPGLAIGVTTADCGPVLFADAAARRDRRRACRLARRVHRRAGSDDRRDGDAAAPIARSIVAALGPMIRQPNYEVGPEFVARFTAADAANAALLQAVGARAATPCSICPATSRRGLRRAGIGRVEDLGSLHLCRSGALLQLPPLDPSRRAGLRPARQCDRAASA